MTTYRPVLCNDEDFSKYVAESRQEKGKDKPKIKLSRVNIKINFEGIELKVVGTVILNTQDEIAFISHTQARHFAAIKGSLACEVVPGLEGVIKGSNFKGIELPFVSEQKRPLYIPATRSAAAGVILAFHNGMRDPLEKIISIYTTDSVETADEITRLITTYYMCCIKYLTDVNFKDVVIKGKTEYISVMLDDLTCIPGSLVDRYNKLKNDKTQISHSSIAFHAVYGAYVLCRPVANKREFKAWVTKRYNAFLSSILHTAETNAFPDLQKGGNQVNNQAFSRPSLRMAVYNIINSDYEDIRNSAIKTHVKMLTALSEMTTYSLVQKVIATGGSVILLKPLPEQIISFVKEKQEIEELLIKNNYKPEDIIYIHLFMPHIQLSQPM